LSKLLTKLIEDYIYPLALVNLVNLTR